MERVQIYLNRSNSTSLPNNYKKVILMQYNFTFREKDKGWQVILSYKDSDGRWKQKSKQGFLTKKAAKAYGQDVLEAVRAQVKTAASRPKELDGITLREFAAIVLKAKDLEYNSVRSYINALLRFGVTLTDKPVADITYLDITSAMQDWMYSPASRRQSLTFLKQLLKLAVHPYSLRPDNPAESISLPSLSKHGKQGIHALTKSELMELLHKLKQLDIRIYTIAAIAGLAGLRYGEIIGLLRSDVDIKNGTISVTKQFNLIGDRKYGTKSIKNGANGYRRIPIPALLCRIISEYTATVPPHISGRLFPIRSSCTGHINSRIKKIFPGTTIHDLRHTYASLLLANGENIKTVAALIGDDIATVLHTYIDYTDDMRQQASLSIARIFA
nr:MAG TPA: Integrase [Caudoviricetes sp.]